MKSKYFGIVLALGVIVSLAPNASAASPPTGKASPVKTAAVVKKPAAPVHRAAAPAHKTPIGKAGTHTAARGTPAAKTGATATTAKATPGELTWNSVTTGFALAKKVKKPILVDFFTEWCGWCKVMDRDTYGDPAVKKLLASKFVLVKADAEDKADGEKLASECQVRGFPTAMFFDPAGKLKAKAVGFVPANEFEGMLDEFLTGKPRVPQVAPGAPPGTDVQTTPAH